MNVVPKHRKERNCSSNTGLFGSSCMDPHGSGLRVRRTRVCGTALGRRVGLGSAQKRQIELRVTQVNDHLPTSLNGLDRAERLTSVWWFTGT